VVEFIQHRFRSSTSLPSLPLSPTPSRPRCRPQKYIWSSPAPFSQHCPLVPTPIPPQTTQRHRRDDRLHLPIDHPLHFFLSAMSASLPSISSPGLLTRLSRFHHNFAQIGSAAISSRGGPPCMSFPHLNTPVNLLASFPGVALLRVRILSCCSVQ